MVVLDDALLQGSQPVLARGCNQVAPAVGAAQVSPQWLESPGTDGEITACRTVGVGVSVNDRNRPDNILAFLLSKLLCLARSAKWTPDGAQDSPEADGHSPVPTFALNDRLRRRRHGDKHHRPQVSAVFHPTTAPPALSPPAVPVHILFFTRALRPTAAEQCLNIDDRSIAHMHASRVSCTRRSSRGSVCASAENM